MRLNKTLEFAVDFARFAINHGITDHLKLAEAMALRNKISVTICRQNSADEPKIEKMRAEFEDRAAALGFAEVTYDCHLPSLNWKSPDGGTRQVFPPSLG